MNCRWHGNAVCQACKECQRVLRRYRRQVKIARLDAWLAKLSWQTVTLLSGGLGLAVGGFLWLVLWVLDNLVPRY